jgi:hypothetical protein
VAYSIVEQTNGHRLIAGDFQTREEAEAALAEILKAETDAKERTALEDVLHIRPD